MSRTVIFAAPESVDIAYVRISDLKQQIAEIGLQLSQPKTKSEEPGWRRSALTALVRKRQEKDFLTEWIRQNKLTKRERMRVPGVPSIGEHFRTHAKIIGRLANLLTAAEEHSKEDTDGTFEALADAVSKVNEFIIKELE